jgi:hypothetical protein
LALWLEETVAETVKEALPGASVWKSLKWHDPVTGKDFENDTVILIDRWLVVVESKSGQVTDSARRGSYDRLKREIGKLMIEPAEQSGRFVSHLLDDGRVHRFKCANGETCEIDSRVLEGTIRLNLLTENIGNLNARSSTH